MRFYFIRDAYFAQIEAWSVLGFRFGFTAFGLAVWPPTDNRKTMPWWAPHVRLEFGSYVGQCAQRWLFRFVFGKRRIGYRTRGDATPNLATYHDAGFCVK